MSPYIKYFLRYVPKKAFSPKKTLIQVLCKVLRRSRSIWWKFYFWSLPIHFSTCLLCFLVRLQKLIFLFSHFSFPLEKILHGDMCCHPDCNRCPDHLFKHKLKMMKTADALFYYLLPYHMKKKKILHTHFLWFDKPPYFFAVVPELFLFLLSLLLFIFYDYLYARIRELQD